MKRSKTYRQSSVLGAEPKTQLLDYLLPKDAQGKPIATVGVGLDTQSLMGITVVGLVLILASKFIPNRK